MTLLSRNALELLVPGATHVIERDGKEAYVYFEPGGVSHMLLDGGETRRGQWSLDEDGYTAHWDTGAVGRWQIEHEAGTVSYVNRDNAARMRMLGVLFGNAKSLPRQS
jgi:hypothetical protein